MNDSDKIKKWTQIIDNYKDGLIIGNGASIAVNPEHFSYESIYKKAVEISAVSEELSEIFDSFHTQDFEIVLRRLTQAHIVNRALSIYDKNIEKYYRKCRESLINTVREIHPKYYEMDKNELDRIASFLKNFKTVVSLNYDLILYWVMHQGNQPIHDELGFRDGPRFKDGFIYPLQVDKIEDKYFSFDWDFLRVPYKKRLGSTLVFYLHGNLTLAERLNVNLQSKEVKITSEGKSHLDEIYEKWDSGYYSPLFICEGEKNGKLISILNSPYLSTVYNNVLQELGDSIAIYGWGLNDQDDYILERLGEIHKTKPIKKIALSVHRNVHEYGFIQKAKYKIENIIDKSIELDFYDAGSNLCWNNT